MTCDRAANCLATDRPHWRSFVLSSVFKEQHKLGARVSHEAEVPLWLRAVVTDRRISDRRQSDHGGRTDAGWPVAPHRRRPERVHILRPAARKCQSEPQARGNTGSGRQDALMTTR